MIRKRCLHRADRAPGVLHQRKARGLDPPVGQKGAVRRQVGLEPLPDCALLGVDKNAEQRLKEASVDTFIGAIIMFPLSVIIIKTCIDYFKTSSEIAAFANFILLTILAIIRKALVRLQFSKYD